MATEQILQWVLRLIGSSSLLALLFVAVPYRWMNAIHAALGMGPLPRQPVVGYLARSASAFYALLGGLLWVVSFDPARHHLVLIYLGCAMAALGIVLLIVDWAEGMPLFWTVWEGPIVVAFGLAILFLSRAVGA